MKKQSGKDLSKRNDQIKRILQDIEQQRDIHQKKGRNFTALDEEQLRVKLGRARSPMIVSQSWGNAPAGGSLNYTVNIHNPDPAGWVWLFGTVFVGQANIIPDVGQALNAIDDRFARLTLPAFPGLSLGANETAELTYTVQVPAQTPSTNYQGNIFIYQVDWHDTGEYLDRGTFVFAVT